ncbi:MAG: radical SAM protein, partial [Vicinamibacteria bacterium]
MSGYPPYDAVDYHRVPFIVLWELTRACDLACRHCRAEAVPQRDPRELRMLEALALLQQIRGFGSPIVVITGGDPLNRSDVFDLVRFGNRIGLRMTMTPSGTPLLTPRVIERLQT